jgi:hypothetical protein
MVCPAKTCLLGAMILRKRDCSQFDVQAGFGKAYVLYFDMALRFHKTISSNSHPKTEAALIDSIRSQQAKEDASVWSLSSSSISQTLVMEKILESDLNWQFLRSYKSFRLRFLASLNESKKKKKLNGDSLDYCIQHI